MERANAVSPFKSQDIFCRQTTFLTVHPSCPKGNCCILQIASCQQSQVSPIGNRLIGKKIRLFSNQRMVSYNHIAFYAVNSSATCNQKQTRSANAKKAIPGLIITNRRGNRFSECQTAVNSIIGQSWHTKYCSNNA